MLCTKNISSHQEHAPALSAPAPAAANVSPTSITWPRPPSTLLSPHNASLSTACSRLPSAYKKLTSSANLCKQHSNPCPCTAMLRLCYIAYFLTKCRIFHFWYYLSRISCTFSSFNISLMTSVTEVTRGRFCKVLFKSSSFFSNGC